LQIKHIEKLICNRRLAGNRENCAMLWSFQGRALQQRVRVGTVEIAYQVLGQGPPLLLIHGLSGSGRWWARNVQALAQHFRVYVIDLVGFGASRGRQAFVLPEAAGYLARWMQASDFAPAAVVGHSMGGHIAAELAADFPELVGQLVLVDAALLPIPPSYARNMLNMLREARQLPFDFMPVLVGDALRAGVITLWKAANELLKTDLRPKLAQVSAPTLVVWGENDALLPLAMGRQISQHLRFDELVIMKHAGHNPMWDCPRAFNQVVLEFLCGSSPGGERQVDCEHARPAI
jgi:pimeloyl-ACP methyl ester carboxylesterase